MTDDSQAYSNLAGQDPAQTSQLTGVKFHPSDIRGPIKTYTSKTRHSKSRHSNSRHECAVECGKSCVILEHKLVAIMKRHVG